MTQHDSATTICRIYGSAINNATNPFLLMAHQTFPRIPILPSDANCVLLDLVGDRNISAMTNLPTVKPSGRTDSKEPLLSTQKKLADSSKTYISTVHAGIAHIEDLSDPRMCQQHLATISGQIIQIF